MKMYFVLAIPLYSVGKPREDDHADYDVFGSHAMKDVAKALREVIKPEAYGHLYCSAL